MSTENKNKKICIELAEDMQWSENGLSHIERVEKIELDKSTFAKVAVIREDYGGKCRIGIRLCTDAFVYFKTKLPYSQLRDEIIEAFGELPAPAQKENQTGGFFEKACKVSDTKQLDSLESGMFYTVAIGHENDPEEKPKLNADFAYCNSFGEYLEKVHSIRICRKRDRCSRYIKFIDPNRSQKLDFGQPLTFVAGEKCQKNDHSLYVEHDFFPPLDKL